jgi:NAD(P)-dependent dehydrogenase (short-subunit alcohol dehydrogenase family)
MAPFGVVYQNHNMNTPKIALVTGANRGIGMECCRQLAEQGHTVILTSRDQQKGQQAAAKLQKQFDQVSYHQLDVNEPESIGRLRDWVADTYGRLDILINNAAINYDSGKRASTVDLEEVRRTLDINLFGPWRMCQALLPLMKKHGYGRIVNVSSGSGMLSGMGADTPSYSVSKAALNVLTIKLAAENPGSNLLINAVCPGWVRTDMGGSAAPRSVEQGAQSVLWAALLPEDGPTGGFFRDGKRLEW